MEVTSSPLRQTSPGVRWRWRRGPAAPACDGSLQCIRGAQQTMRRALPAVTMTDATTLEERPRGRPFRAPGEFQRASRGVQGGFDRGQRRDDGPGAGSARARCRTRRAKDRVGGSGSVDGDVARGGRQGVPRGTGQWTPEAGGRLSVGETRSTVHQEHAARPRCDGMTALTGCRSECRGRATPGRTPR